MRLKGGPQVDLRAVSAAEWGAALMYFTYCQLWLYVCAKAHYLDVVRQERLSWEKTVRTPLATRSPGR